MPKHYGGMKKQKRKKVRKRQKEIMPYSKYSAKQKN